jgi:polyvinyl alcohol dehydrogenase (cytochrome)
VLHILDAEKPPAIIRQIRAGKGGVMGGIEWGPAADRDRVYVAISDLDFAKPESGGGLTAFQIGTGERIWHAPAPKPSCLAVRGCRAAQPAAVTSISGAVFSGSLDGHLRAYSSADGKLIWDLDTRQAFATVNNVPARGGSLNAAGPTVVGGMLLVNSGYGILGGSAGNVLLAYTVDGR